MKKKYDDNNSGAVFFVPEGERKKEKSPHFNGKAKVDGVEWFVVAWENTYTHTDGSERRNISFKFNEPRPKEESSKVVGTIDSPYNKEDLPF